MADTSGNTKPSPLDDPRVRPHEYVVEPTGFADMVHDDKHYWRLFVVDGGRWGWSVRQYSSDSPRAMNRKGAWIHESRSNEGNRFRRWPLEEALAIALAHVDTMRINGRTAQEASDWVAARLAADGDKQ